MSNPEYESFERAEQRRYEDIQHRREMRTVSWVATVIAAGFILTIYFLASACNSSWQRSDEMQKRCLAEHGSWETHGTSGSGCQFTQKDK